MLLSGVIAGLTLGIAIGQDWRRIERLNIRWFPLLAAALVVRAVGPFVPFALEMYVVAILLTGVFAALNWRLPGTPLIGIGSLLNLIVIIANGAMPIDAVALEAAGGRMPTDAIHVPLNDHALLALLADVIVIPVIAAAYSIGDVLIAIGGFLVPFVTLTRR